MSNNSTNQGTVVAEQASAIAAPIHEVIEVPVTIPSRPLGRLCLFIQFKYVYFLFK